MNPGTVATVSPMDAIGAAATTNYDKVIATKIKTCRSNFRSGDFDPWRSSDFDPCRSSGVDQISSGVKLQIGGDRSVG